MTEQEWKKKYPGVKKHVPKSKPTPYPYERDSAHFEWFNSIHWTLCHGFVHGKAHAWVEFKNIVIDFQVKRKGALVKQSKKKFLLDIAEALNHVRGAKKQQTQWEKKLQQFSHNKNQYYKNFNPTNIKKYNREEMCQMLDYYGRYGQWEGAPSPFAGVI